MTQKEKDLDKIKEYNRQYYLKKTKLKREKAKETRVPRQVECAVCGTLFTPKSSIGKYCCDACREIGNRIVKKLYRKTDTFKAQRKRYMKSETYKKIRARYVSSEKWKQAQERYRKSEKGKLSIARTLAKRKARLKAEKKNIKNLDK